MSRPAIRIEHQGPVKAHISQGADHYLVTVTSEYKREVNGVEELAKVVEYSVAFHADPLPKAQRAAEAYVSWVNG